MTDYERLKQIIQQANPEIMGDWSGCNVCGTMCGICDDRFYKEKVPRPIRLADMLLAVKEKERIQTEEIEKRIEEMGSRRDIKYPLFYTVMMTITKHDMDGGKEFWNLKTDNLDHQSDETKQFLIELLTPK